MAGVLHATEAVRDNASSFYCVLTCVPGYVAVIFSPSRFTVYSFCVGVYIVSVPGYTVAIIK